MKNLQFIIVLVLITNVVYSQSAYMLNIKQGEKTVYAQTSEIDELKFAETSTFSCGQSILYAGELYPTVQIGTQCWFAKNLNVGQISNPWFGQTNNSIAEKYCYENIEASCITFGGLYEWGEAVQFKNGASNSTSPNPAFSGNVQGLCPKNWHIPTSAEFTTLSNSAAVGEHATKLFAYGQGDGFHPGTNTTGFSVLLVGYLEGVNYMGIPNFSRIWTLDNYNNDEARYLYLDYDSDLIRSFYRSKFDAYSIRCVKD